MAFIQRDGCSEGSTVLHTSLRSVHQDCIPMASFFVDTCKASDLVSHDTIIRAASMFGLPSPMVDCPRSRYAGSMVRLGDESIACSRGVRQGDPLSTLMFISVMDEALSNSVPAPFVTIGGSLMDHLVYADDSMLFADNADRLREHLGALSTLLAAAGMRINGAKTISLTVLKDGKNKRLILWPTAYEVNGSVHIL
ncbi:hypothetical protein D915_007032 [Fasciola hepatica]|uniref:Uncharacterized protein n=1 Tax=Fasciola hepatica TaxID=6192 RepID=A0A2H1C4V5_FASHE|nr:hypothetical protein D915_007032 [Fasciola hepatica]